MSTTTDLSSAVESRDTLDIGETVSETILLRTVLDLADVADDDVTDWNLNQLAAANRRKAMLVLDAALKPAKLFLLLPVVERRDQNDDQDRHEDSDALDPAGFRLRVIRETARLHSCTTCTAHSNQSTYR